VPTLLDSAKRAILTWLEWTTPGLRLSLLMRHRVARPRGVPNAPWHNAVLKTRKEADAALGQVRALGLPVMHEVVKNWDTLGVLDLILKSTDKNAQVFDAGGALYSMILHWLFLYGYRNLSAGNLVFKGITKKGPIVYHYADITKTGLAAESLDVVTCLSVIEHGVDLRSYFAEMSRILKAGGLLITSTDYFESATDTRGQKAFGTPIHVFTRNEIAEALNLAREYGLCLTGPLDLTSNERVVNWKQYGLDYTFVLFSLKKTQTLGRS
jgi:hypothetical protein